MLLPLIRPPRSSVARGRPSALRSVPEFSLGGSGNFFTISESCVDISPLRGLDRMCGRQKWQTMCFPTGSRSLAKRQQPDSRFRSGTFDSNLGRNCLPDINGAHGFTRKDSGGERHSNEADARPHGTFVRCDQKASVPVREHFTDSLLPNVLQYRPLRAQKRGRLFAFSIPRGGNPSSRAVMSAGAVSERTAASRRMLGGRSSCGLSRGATRSTRAVPVGIEKREAGLSDGSRADCLALARISLPTDMAGCFEGLAQTFKFGRRHLRLLRRSLGHT